MADNRHFTDALQNEGGSPVYLEDKKLAERTAVSGAASIANLKFLLANDDTEGFNTAIKAYIDEAIRSALGALVNNLDKGTAVSRILATDGNNDLGTITPANLASVLGAMVCDITNAPYRKPAIQASERLTIRNSGIYTYTGNPYGTLIVFNAGYYQCQIDIPADLQYQYVEIRTTNNDRADWSSITIEKH